MAIDWKPLTDMVEAHRRFLLTTHVRPDGDGIGSMIALRDCLMARGRQVRMTVASDVPPRYRFLDPAGEIERFEAPGDGFRDVDAVLVLDTGTWNQLGEFGPFLRTLKAARGVIDHHLTQDDLGAARFVDATAEATGRLAHDAILALGGPLTPRASQALFVALATDTGWFRHSNTQPRTLELAAELVGRGAKPDELYDQLFERNSLARMKLVGLVLERLAIVGEGRVAFAEIHRDDYVATGASPADTEELVNYTRSLAGVEVGLLFLEQPRGGVKVSFRSRRAIDVAKIAEQFGGGGHRLASGATIETSLAEAKERVVSAVLTAIAASTETTRSHGP
jgi:phosphoesterase RecJ-like protein